MFLPEEFHGQRSLVSYSPCVVKNCFSVLLPIWILCKTIHKMCFYVTEQQETTSQAPVAISLHSLLLIMPSNVKGKSWNLSSIFSSIWKVFLLKSQTVSFHNIRKYLHWSHIKEIISLHIPLCTEMKSEPAGLSF